jgi:hypothetical protein
MRKFLCVGAAKRNLDEEEEEKDEARKVFVPSLRGCRLCRRRRISVIVVKEDDDDSEMNCVMMRMMIYARGMEGV